MTADEGLKRIADSMREYAPRSTNEAFWLRAARALGINKGEVVLGIPVSITGKSVYFDRQAPAKH